MVTKARYVCLLRGVNVSGKNLVRMEALRDAFGKLGFTDVATYVQSGNIVFGSTASAKLAAKIERMMADELGCAVSAIVKSAAEIDRVVHANPFLTELGVDSKTLHVTFLAEAPSAAGLAKLEAIDAGRDRFVAIGSELYLHTPDGYGRTKLSNVPIERALDTRATTRNWRTVTTLQQMLRS